MCRLVLLGPPASGKGTQTEQLTEWCGAPATSTGAILRQQKAEGTELGKEADRQTRGGNLVPDDVIMTLVEGWLEDRDGRFIFDGFPRTLPQARALNGVLEKRGTPLDRVILLDLPEETIRERVRNRVVCGDCGWVFNLGFHVDSMETPCPACGGKLTRRADDDPDALARRLEVYHAKTEPLIPFYENLGLLARIEADRPVDEVFKSIQEVLS